MTSIPEKNQPVKPERTYPKNQILEWMVRIVESGILRTLPPNYLKVFFVLYSYRNPEGYAWPSQKTLIEKSGCCKRTVIKALKIGRACLGIKVEKKGRKNKYFLPVHEVISSWQPTRGRKKGKVHPIDTYLPEKKKESGKNEKKI